MSNVDVGILKQEVLSLLVSAKYGLTEHELLNDYRLFNSNKDLPYRDLGYSSLISLLRSWPDVCRFQSQGNNGAMTILAVEEENTKHILSMVKGQRQGKPRRRTRGGRNRGRGGGGGRNVARDNYGGRFSENIFNSNNNNNNNNRFRGNDRGASNGRMAYNNNRSERSNVSTRSAMGQSYQNSRNKSNGSQPSRSTKQQQPPSRSYTSGTTQSSMSSYDSRQPTNSHFFDDRRVINNSTSLRVTVSNNANEMNNHYQYSPDTPYQLSEYALNEDEEQYNEEEEDDKEEEEVINNLQNLLAEYSHGVRLLALDDLYQRKYGKSLLTELKITNILLLPDYVYEFAYVSRHGEENGSCDHIIILKDPKQVAQTQAELLQQITDSGIVSSTFHYAHNLYSYINDPRFQGFVSDIDKNEHCIHIQPVRYQEHIETLMEELDSYYSSSKSNSLIIKTIEAGLSCVTQYDGIYHRVFIKESDYYKCVIVYVDYGTTEEINKDEQQFKYLLNHFAELPCMAIACRLDDIYFIPDDQHWSVETYNEVYALCKDGPFFIEPTGFMNGLLTIRILDADQRCLNDIVVELKLAVKISKHSNNGAIEQYNQEQQNVPKPVELQFNILDNAAQCPLTDSEPSTPESNTIDFEFKLPEKTSSNVGHRCKLIQIDENNSFYLIRYTDNIPYIPCFHLAHLLHLSESDILSETLLRRIRLQQTDEFRPIFDFLRQTDPKNCLHIHQNFLFLFDLISTITFIQQLNRTNTHIIIETLRQQIEASKDSQFWHKTYDCYKPSMSVAPITSAQSSHQQDYDRYNELLAHRNILCNMLRVNNVTENSLQLESIENELQLLIEKIRLGAPSQQNSNVSLTPPPGFTTSSITDQQQIMIKKTDKLKDLMERCKKLINIILVLDDYVDIDNAIIRYIQTNLPFLSSQKASSHDEQLHKQYSELLENLTIIVDQLRQKLPVGVRV